MFSPSSQGQCACSRLTPPPPDCTPFRLQNLPTLTSEAGLQSPTLLIIGEVVALAPGWQEWEANGMPLEWRQSDRPRYEQYKQYTQYGLGPSGNDNIVIKAAPTATRQTHQATAIDRYQ